MTPTTELVPAEESTRELPPILLGRHTAPVEAQVRSFYQSVAQIFERWVTRRSSEHTQRAYRQDVLSFVEFLELRWPEDSTRLFTVSVADVLAFRDLMLEELKAPKTINRRIASLSSFYKYLQGCASEFRLPITVPNPAHAQFISRGSSDPRDETKALSATRARQLMGLPSGDSVFDFRDRAIIKFFLYSGARLGTACRLKVSDFHQDGDEATITLHEKGDKHRRIGLHFAAAEAISEYIAKASLKKGPLFRAQRNSRVRELGDKHMNAVTMYKLLQGYLSRLPGSMHEEEVVGEDGVATKISRCVYTPHSLRATTATLLLDAGVDIIKVKELLGHRHVTTTQIYDKRRRSLKEGASHDVPI
ncbi:MAG: tyrosine-type recombinase/integrase [Isosphaeraceae bacterium]